jgi:ketosteroid isomerase-like protein
MLSMIVASEMASPDDALAARIRTAYALFNEQKLIDRDLFSDEVEWHNAPEFPGASVHHGVDAVVKDIHRQQEAWGESRFHPVEIIPAGDDRYVVLLDVQVKGASSGATASLEGGHILTLRDGKVVRVEAFIGRDQALAAAGIERGT